MFRRVLDWDDAYANGPNIPRGEQWPNAWIEPARLFRERLQVEQRAKLDITYGPRPRNRFDLFLPDGAPKGLVIYVHGGFWHRLDKSFWSHLAQGSVDRGFAVAIPGYTLCPDVRVRDITAEIGAAVTAAAAMVPGPLLLAGHSAGGHLVTRMISHTSPLAPDVRGRIRNTVSISGLHDLRPLLHTGMNALIRLDEEEACEESPALLAPMPDARLVCWVGASERAEFIRQSALLANIWTGLGATTTAIEEPDRHHFDVIDGLADSSHALTSTLLEPNPA